MWKNVNFQNAKPFVKNLGFQKFMGLYQNYNKRKLFTSATCVFKS